jgi:hypothetical protein
METENDEQQTLPALESVDILLQLKPERETWLPEDKARVVNYCENDRGR